MFIFIFFNQSVSVFPVCVVGGGSASKEHNKKRVAEFKELANVEIVALSPERR